MKPDVIVQRRFPTYDFVLPSPLSVNEASAALDRFLASQQRPRGFVIFDPRVDGVVSGSTFSLRRRQSGFGGSVAPYAEGYFVPADGGSNVMVRVAIPAVWWFFDAFMVVVVLATFDFRITAESLGAVVLVVIFEAAMIVLPTWTEASRIVKLLRTVLG